MMFDGENIIVDHVRLIHYMSMENEGKLRCCGTSVAKSELNIKQSRKSECRHTYSVQSNLGAGIDCKRLRLLIVPLSRC